MFYDQYKHMELLQGVNMNVYWFLPLEEDTTLIGTWPPEGPEPSLDYMTSVVRASETSGFDGLLVHTGYALHLETWVAAAAVLSRTERVQLIVAVRPNQYHPAQAAKMAASLQQLFPGRVALNVVSGASDEDTWIGNYDNRETRYHRVREWLDIVRGIWYGDSPFGYQGQVYKVEETWLNPELSGPIPIFFSGSSPEAQAIAVEHADLYLLWGGPVADVARHVAHVQALAGGKRELRLAMRIHVIVRPTEGEAWKVADRLISRVDPEIQTYLADQMHEGSPGRAAQQELTRENLVLGRNLWAGIGIARLGVSVALVGNPLQIVDRLMEYRLAGIDAFILSGYPKLEEAIRFGELVMPLLREAEARLQHKETIDSGC